MKRAGDRQAADELGNQPEADQILRLELFEHRAEVARLLRLDVGLEAHRLAADAAFNHLLEADEGAAADEEDVGGVDLEELLVRVLAPALRCS